MAPRGPRQARASPALVYSPPSSAQSPPAAPSPIPRSPPPRLHPRPQPISRRTCRVRPWPPLSDGSQSGTWSDMVTVVSPGVSAHQRPRVGRTSLRGLQIRLSTGQHNTAAGGTSITPCVTSLQHHLSHSKKKKEREILGCKSSIVSYNAQKILICKKFNYYIFFLSLLVLLE